MNEQTPASACCGAEIKKYVVNVWRGKGCFVEERKKCSECGDTLFSQPPASKGEGWRRKILDWLQTQEVWVQDAPFGNVQIEGRLQIDDLARVIQTAIDEAVENYKIEESKRARKAMQRVIDLNS